MNAEDKLAPNLKCCKGIKSDGSVTVFIYCVNTDLASFEANGDKLNFDCREGARTLVIGSLVSFLLAVVLTQ